MTPRQLEIIQHALGCDQYGQKTERFVPASPRHLPYHRNHFCAGAGDESDCRVLIDMDYMREHARTTWLPYLNCSVTDAGIKAMRDESPAPPKLTRSQIRYRDFLHADSSMTFKEWIVSEKQRKEYYATHA